MAPSTYRKLQDKHVIIIGGSAGIGYAVAEAALSDGAHVTIASSKQQRIDAAVKKLEEDYGPSAVVQGFVCDLRQEDVEGSVEMLFQAATTSGSRHSKTINHVVLTAAELPVVVPLAETTMASMASVTHMRLTVSVMLAKVAERYLPKDVSSSITLTSGQAVEKPPRGWGVFNYHNGGIISLVRGLALDMAPVRVNVVKPGIVLTDLLKTLEPEQLDFFKKEAKKLPLGGIGNPEDVAEAYIWLMKDKYATGTEAASNGGGLLI